MTLTGLSRRRFIGAASSAAATATLINVGAAGTAVAATGKGVEPHAWKGKKSRNGWPVLAQAPSHGSEGSSQKVRLAESDASVILLHVARRFHYETDSLRAGDAHGWTAHADVTEPYESNYSSGSAVAIRPLCYPSGPKGNFYPNGIPLRTHAPSRSPPAQGRGPQDPRVADRPRQSRGGRDRRLRPAPSPGGSHVRAAHSELSRFCV